MRKAIVLFGLLILGLVYLINSQSVIYAASLDDLTAQIKIIQNDGKYIGALFFDAFGTNTGTNSVGNTSISLSTFELSDVEISSGWGGPWGKIGINFDNFYSQPDSFYQRAQGLGMQFSLEIATKDGPVLQGLNAAHSHGLTPVIRIGVGGDNGGFADAAAYVSFLSDINKAVNYPVYAIAGPNEPETELWLTPNCNGNPPDASCIGPKVATFMNDVIAGASGFSNIKLLSPAFNFGVPASWALVKEF